MYCITFGEFLQIVGIGVSLLACVYTVLTYNKTHDIFDVIESERKFWWNKKQLERLFNILPIDCIESFLEDPTIFRNELWIGLRSVYLIDFQFKGAEKTTIIEFIQALNSFKSLRYVQVQSNHWKFEPLSSKSPFEVDKKVEQINLIYAKAKAIKPLFEKIRQILLKYQVDIEITNIRAYEDYEKKMKDQLLL